MIKLLLLHGPNLNMLGKRELTHYGNRSLDEINQCLCQQANTLGYALQTHQSNAEHELIDLIQSAGQQDIKLILFNPAAYTHTSIALRDALLAVAIPFIEIHMSNLASREPFRQTSLFSDIALGTIEGFAEQSYYLALQAAHTHLTQQ